MTKWMLTMASCFGVLLLQAQLPISFVQKENQVDVLIHDQPFTSLLYPDSLEKPVLFPVFAPDQQLVTRGFPLAPRAGDPTDHPHHIGIWLNFENLNQLDFWNNSYAIPAKDKAHYGRIVTRQVKLGKGGKRGVLVYQADWVAPSGERIVTEKTELIFSGDNRMRRIDRITKLTAAQDAFFKDAKDGLLGFRVDKELQLPTADYLNSEGLRGDSVWSKRARWCRLSARMGKDTVAIVILDHPENIGYPSYWHARGYGLFAVNPLGAAIFSQEKDRRDLHLKKGESVRFHYTILISAAENDISETEINHIADRLR